jgi:hypothetical protein
MAGFVRAATHPLKTDIIPTLASLTSLRTEAAAPGELPGYMESIHAGNCKIVTVNRIAGYSDLYKLCDKGNSADKLS